MSHSLRRGIALLEVLASLVILAAAGLALLALDATATAAFRAALRAEQETREASRVLVSYARLSDAGLDTRVGRRVEDGFRVRVSLVQPRLYRVEVLTLAGIPLLATSYYRPGGERGRVDDE